MRIAECLPLECVAAVPREVRVALAGNHNSGKTTIFNNLTGARQHVGNYPGVTVEKKSGTCHHHGVRVNVFFVEAAHALAYVVSVEFR